MSPVASTWWEAIWQTLGESVLGAGSGQQCCSCLLTCAKRVSPVLQQLFPVSTCLVHHLPVALAGARGWRCTSNLSKLLWPWTVGGKEPKLLSGRKSKCLKIKIHLWLKWKIRISASCVKQIQGNVDYFPRNCSISFNAKCNSHTKYWMHGYKGSM